MKTKKRHLYIICNNLDVFHPKKWTIDKNDYLTMDDNEPSPLEDHDFIILAEEVSNHDALLAWIKKI